jgi:hypothetical protein
MAVVLICKASKLKCLGVVLICRASKLKCMGVVLICKASKLKCMGVVLMCHTLQRVYVTQFSSVQFSSESVQYIQQSRLHKCLLWQVDGFAGLLFTHLDCHLEEEHPCSKKSQAEGQESEFV